MILVFFVGSILNTSQASQNTLNTASDYSVYVGIGFTDNFIQGEDFSIYKLEVTNNAETSFFISKIAVWIAGLNNGTVENPIDYSIMNFYEELEVEYLGWLKIIAKYSPFNISIPEDFALGEHYFNVGLFINNDWVWMDTTRHINSFEVEPRIVAVETPFLNIDQIFPLIFIILLYRPKRMRK